MKKSIGIFGIFVLLLSTVTLMSSCKKDVSNLPGKWKIVTATINGDEENDLKDEWTFYTDGTCKIDCDFDEYFDHTLYDLVTFDGKYVTEGNKKLTINSNRFNVSENGKYYDMVVYDMDILLLNKNSMMVSGTIEYYQCLDNVTNKQKSNISLSLSKK
jgi:hypothetical protein